MTYNGRAVAVPGGYRITGRWSQGSNILIARWLHVGCHVHDGDRPRLGPDGLLIPGSVRDRSSRSLRVP